MRSWSVIPGGQSSFDHRHVESLNHSKFPYEKPGSHLEFFLKIQHVHGQKIIPPHMTDQDLT